MDTRTILEAAHVWIVNKQAASAKPRGEKFDLTSLYYCVKEGNPTGVTFAEIEGAMSELRIAASKTARPAHYTVMTPHDALELIGLALKN